MAEPQVWTLRGVPGAALFGMLTVMSTLFLRVIRVEIGSVHLDRDVQALTRRVMGDDAA